MFTCWAASALCQTKAAKQQNTTVGSQEKKSLNERENMQREKDNTVRGKRERERVKDRKM